ncbi:MAG: class E sortase [Acidimicrobiia bacterium]|nr:class E sortase [Acidimicrobiia bacterium]
MIGALGRSFVTVGLLILLFVTYQLWGTGIYTSREQDRLRNQFTSSVDNHGDNPAVTTTSSVTEPTAPTTTTTLQVPLAPLVPEGGAIAQIRIPRIAVDSIVVQGVSREDLRKGPGHYPDSPLPGQEGNAAIAGHRTTYGAPFGNLDQLENGDRIFTRTAQGNFTYTVYDTIVVQPTELEVLNRDRFRPATLTLTTCNPKYSAAQRLVVKAVLQEPALPAAHPTGKTPKLTEDGLSGGSSSKLPTLISGLIAAAIGLLWWLLFHRHPSLPNWLIGVLPFAAALFVFYALLERVLPSNY